MTTTSTTTRLTKADYLRIWNEAKIAGELAARATHPTPIEVYDAHLDGSPVKGGGRWISPGGVCGFAWVVIKPATGGFVRWLKEQRIGYKGYRGGWTVPAHPDFGRGTPLCQSLEIKNAYARAMAAVLRANGIPAASDYRLD